MDGEMPKCGCSQRYAAEAGKQMSYWLQAVPGEGAGSGWRAGLGCVVQAGDDETKREKEKIRRLDVNILQWGIRYDGEGIEVAESLGRSDTNARAGEEGRLLRFGCSVASAGLGFAGEVRCSGAGATPTDKLEARER
ncbi:uncharacterized protein SPSK_03701 [Sporothrix schenckii 1099-18]|uniref:Uncharacterized protein n=1 Tax=Sporothrix schenckii 1099-18 TaxID=1397361 RepID=A0A0F2LYG3_SPOSC|nr:uncharacterized protein SPSK_03701 [Sporothrix schenckii 1099-18]KJR82493.1 hypothetical protein SPSK_03701 [Sporothrix schenckii 1099-18]